MMNGGKTPVLKVEAAVNANFILNSCVNFLKSPTPNKESVVCNEPNAKSDPQPIDA